MTFKKLALVTAIACVPAATFAVESLDDADLAATSGQDGIEIDLDLNVTTNAIVHDNDGIDASFATSYGAAGAIVITGMSIATNGVHVEIDAGDENGVADTTAVAPMLNVNVELTNAVTLSTGSIGIANSNRDDTGNPWGMNNNTVLISNSTLTIGATDLNIQLGGDNDGVLLVDTEEQGNMISINASITNGLTISGMGINDITSGGTIGSSSLTLVDSGGSDLSVNVGIDVTSAGLVIDINQLGSGSGIDVQIVDQYLGTTTAGIIGDVELQGLNLAGTMVTISGK